MTADYLYVRSSFSDSAEFLDQETTAAVTDQHVRQFEFDYESSFRVGGGYRMCGCGDEIRFMYTRFESSAFDEQRADSNIIVPFLIQAPIGGEYRFHGDVELNTYDLDYAKTIPFGGSNCGGCSSCPAWDLSVSGGFRAADVNWLRSYTAFGLQQQFLESAVSTMDFEGAGLKVGLQGRRYFCKSGWLSMYAKGNLSLLYGRLDFNSVRTEEISPTVPDIVVRQSTTSNQIVPVTDLEAGVSGQVSCNCRLSAGYLFSAWHDLGFRDQIQIDDDFPVQYDDANILGFDGLFARLEFAY